jgi:LmbE family N-acetylglucosaminyl deacetylase
VLSLTGRFRPDMGLRAGTPCPGHPVVSEKTMTPVALPTRIPTTARPGAALRGRAVVFLHAHPDDEAIFTGATMHRLAAAGARVVLVTATGGELGPVLAPLALGETLAARRRGELERACAALGVARLVLFDHRDSGMAGWADNRHPAALAQADLPTLARRLADLCLVERAEALVHYDGDGIYPHPDHLAVHEIGSAAARLAGAAEYQSTVDRRRPRAGHLVEAAAGGAPVGRDGTEIGTMITADRTDLAAKRAAMAAHASQIPALAVRRRGFAATYGREWYLRRHAPGLLDELPGASRPDALAAVSAARTAGR